MTPVRHPEPLTVRQYLFGDYRMDMAAYQLWRGNDLITLMPKVFDTLAVLIQHRDRVVGKDELLTTVWPDYNVTEDSLTQTISILRKTLGDDTAHPKLISTVARRGYRFIASVVEIPEDQTIPDAEPKPASDLVPTSPPPPSIPSLIAVAPAPADGMLAYYPPPPANRALSGWKPLVTGILVGIAVALAAGIALLPVFSWHRLAPEASPPLRLSVSAPEGTNLISSGVLSPNGRYMLILAADNGSGTGRIWLHALDTGLSRPVPGTADASRPFWSPDSRFVGFFAEGKLKRIGIDSQDPQVITSTPAGASISGAAWSSKGVIVFSEKRSGLYVVPESGGTPTSLTTLDPEREEVAHRWPQFLPDGEHFLYFDVSARANWAGTFIGSLHSKKADRLLDVPALFAQPGYLIYARDRLLMAQAFDPGQPRTPHNPTAIGGGAFQAGIVNEVTLPTANLSASRNGLLAYTGSTGTPRLKWLDQSGREVAAVDIPAPVYNPVLSPDQKQLLVGDRSLDHGLWMVDLSRGVSTRVVSDGMRPLWSPDGARIAFSADRAGVNSIFIRSANGANEETVLLRSGYNKVLNDWSTDGKYILYASLSPETKYDLWVLPMFGDRKPRPFLQTPANEGQGQISPDGHWVAYTSNESGSWEVYLQSFPEPGGKRILSVGGGADPHWRKDGRGLFYLSLDGNLMAVNITLGPSPRIERPRALFRAPVLPVADFFGTQFAVSADSQRFVIGSVERAKKEDQITVLSSWPSLLSH